MARTICRRSPKILAAAGAVALAAAILAAGARSDLGTPPRPADVRVIYVGADDCAPCRTWRQQHWPRFQASPEFARLAFREVRSPKLFDLLKDDHWPEELRKYRDALEPTDGAPLWFVVADDRIVLKARGLRQWEDAALPKINSMVR